MRRIVIAVALLVFFSINARANLLKDLVNSGKKVVDVSVKVATAPTMTVVNTAKVVSGQGSVSSIYQPYVEIGRVAGDATISTANAVGSTQSYLQSKAESLARRIGGDPASFALDLGTFSTDLMTQAGITGAYAAANALKGQNPLEATAAPLAAAIRAARAKYFASAKPLPPDVIAGLKGRMPDSVLARAKYAVGRLEITLPNFIGKGAKFMGKEYAVTVDDIIVFNDSPPTYSNSPEWWAHEIAHVEQYSGWGIDKFAYEYLRDFGSGVEDSADSRAAATTGNAPLQKRSISPAMMATFGGAPDAASPAATARPEFFVAQCIFPNDPYPVHYMVTNTNRIVAVDIGTGQWMQVGWAAPPNYPGVTWNYWTPNFFYLVGPAGDIGFINNYGQWVSVGFVRRIA